jgi:hypothetical protein
MGVVLEPVARRGREGVENNWDEVVAAKEKAFEESR